MVKFEMNGKMESTVDDDKATNVSNDFLTKST